MNNLFIVLFLLLSSCHGHELEKSSPNGQYVIKGIEQQEGQFVNTYISVFSKDNTVKLSKFEIARNAEDETRFLETFSSADWISNSVFAFVQEERWNFQRSVVLSNNGTTPVVAAVINTPNNRFIVVDLGVSDSVTLPIAFNNPIAINGVISFQSGKTLRFQKSDVTPGVEGLVIEIDESKYELR